MIDAFGHLAGDELIRGAGKCLCEVFEKYGKVYRIGGDDMMQSAHITGRPMLTGVNRNHEKM